MKSIQRAEVMGRDDPHLTAVQQDRSNNGLVQHPGNQQGHGLHGDDRGDAAPHLPRPLGVMTDCGGVAVLPSKYVC